MAQQDGPWADGVDPELLGLMEEAYADMEKVWRWINSETAPGGPPGHRPRASLLRARARVAAARAYLWALDGDTDPAESQVNRCSTGPEERP